MKNTPYIKELGEKIRFLRVENNLSQDHLAREIGVTRQTIAKIENGHGGSVAFDTWNAICDYFGFKFNIEQIFIPVSVFPKKASIGLVERIYGNYKEWSDV